MFGFYRTAAAVPQMRVADIAFNLGEIKKLVSEAEKKSVSLIVFPELSITGYTCGDLFLQETVLSGVVSALLDLAKFAENGKKRKFPGFKISRAWDSGKGWIYSVKGNLNAGV